MNSISPSNSTQNSIPTNGQLKKLPFTHGIEVENFITTRQGDILEDGKELVAVWDQMFNGALNYLKSLPTNQNTPIYIKNKIKQIWQKDVERHGKIIRYVQIQYQVNGKVIPINVFGPDPNISQITWLLELVTPPCEYLEELDWWINTLYFAGSQSLTKGYYIQPMGFNPFQTEYRAGVTCGEHHHIGNFRSDNEKKAAYNMIRAYIPHLIAIGSTSPFINSQPTGRIILKRADDGRTLILAPDCVHSIRLKENSGQLGPNIPEYLPFATQTLTQAQFSRFVRKEIPDDRYVDLYPFTSYGTIECRFFDTQFDQNIRLLTVVLLQALALKGSKHVQSNIPMPEIKGNALFEHRKRAVTHGMFAKFEGDPSIESSGNTFAKYYNHNPDDGGPPGKIYESLRALLIWLKPELIEMKITEKELKPLLVMLWGTSRIAPPISQTTFMFYLFEHNQSNVSNVIRLVGLNNSIPGRIFGETLGEPAKSFGELLTTKAAQPIKIEETDKSVLARKLQQDSRLRRKKVMAREKARLKERQIQNAKIQREKVKKEREEEKIRLERLQLLEKAKQLPPKPTGERSVITIDSVRRLSEDKNRRTVIETPRSLPPKQTFPQRTAPMYLPVKREEPKIKDRITVKDNKEKNKKIITSTAIKEREKIKQITTQRKPIESYASTISREQFLRQATKLPPPQITKPKLVAPIGTTTTTITKNIAVPIIKSTTKTLTPTEIINASESFKEVKYIRNVSLYNLPSKIDYSLIIPVIKLKWKKSIIQSYNNFQIRVEAEFIPLEKHGQGNRKIYSEIFNLEKTALQNTCYLPIPIDLNNYSGEFLIKFLVKEKQRDTLLSTIAKLATKTKIIHNEHKIQRLTIPPNQFSDSMLNIKIDTRKRNTRGKITIWALSQRGVVKLYEKKNKFREATFSLDLPIFIPPSVCSADWYVFATFNGRGMGSSAYIKSAPPLTKIIDFTLSGNPPLKSQVKNNYFVELTPKLAFKGRCDVREVEISHSEDTGKNKVLRKYRLNTRIKKGEKFVLESFTWKSPSLRRGLFRHYKQKVITFRCKIVDNVGTISNTLIGIVETPIVTVTK